MIPTTWSKISSTQLNDLLCTLRFLLAWRVAAEEVAAAAVEVTEDVVDVVDDIGGGVDDVHVRCEWTSLTLVTGVVGSYYYKRKNFGNPKCYWKSQFAAQ
jgi:hypothetical protein